MKKSEVATIAIILKYLTTFTDPGRQMPKAAIAANVTRRVFKDVSFVTIVSLSRWGAAKSSVGR
jgi:hypothetical protein